MEENKEPCCNARIRKEIMQNDHSLTHVYFDLSNIQSFNGNKQLGDIKTGQRLEIGYNHTMKSGESRKKTSKSFIDHIYCPFCGKKYK